MTALEHELCQRIVSKVQESDGNFDEVAEIEDSYVSFFGFVDWVGINDGFSHIRYLSINIDNAYTYDEQGNTITIPIDEESVIKEVENILNYY